MGDSAIFVENFSLYALQEDKEDIRKFMSMLACCLPEMQDGCVSSSFRVSLSFQGKWRLVPETVSKMDGVCFELFPRSM